MLNTIVEVKEMNLVGKVFDYNDKIVWVENEEDIFVVNAELVTPVTIAEEEIRQEVEFEKAMAEAGLQYDGYCDFENEFTYYIKGFTYDIMAVLDFNNNTFYMDTKHTGRENEEEWRNKKEFKKLNTLIRNVIKWAEK